MYPLGRWLFRHEAVPSIARILQRGGYATGIAGKWQINDFRQQPDVLLDIDLTITVCGRERKVIRKIQSILRSVRNVTGIPTFIQEGQSNVPREFEPDVYNRFVLNFISKNHERPFFMYYAMTLAQAFTTTPLHLDASDKYEKHRAMVVYVDYLIGKVMAN